MKEIYVAGGCFWGVEHFYSLVKGIVNTKCVYLNSQKEDISYEETCSGVYNAVEAVHIEYDEKDITLEKIIELLFRIIDPTSLNKQGNDKGVQYRVGVYTDDTAEQKVVKNIITEEQKNYTERIVLEVMGVNNSFDAEEYHQKFLYKNVNGYCHINMNKIKKDELK